MFLPDYPRPLSQHEQAQSQRRRSLALCLLLVVVALLWLLTTGLWEQISGWSRGVGIAV